MSRRSRALHAGDAVEPRASENAGPGERTDRANPRWASRPVVAVVAVMTILAIAAILVGPIVVADRCPSCGFGGGWLDATTSIPRAGVTVVTMLGAWLSSAAMRADVSRRSVSDGRSSRSPEGPPAADASA